MLIKYILTKYMVTEYMLIKSIYNTRKFSPETNTYNSSFVELRGIIVSSSQQWDIHLYESSQKKVLKTDSIQPFPLKYVPLAQ